MPPRRVRGDARELRRDGPRERPRGQAAIPKTRSRNEGAAVALDDLDRRLLNLMQGSFPLEPRPYASVADRAEIPEEEVHAPRAAAAWTSGSCAR